MSRAKILHEGMLVGLAGAIAVGANLVAAVVMLVILLRNHHTSLRQVLTSGE